MILRIDISSHIETAGTVMPEAGKKEIRILRRPNTTQEGEANISVSIRVDFRVPPIPINVPILQAGETISGT